MATSFYKNIIILSLLLLCSCKATHDTPPNLPLPNSWNNYSLTPQNNQTSKWWLQFNDPVLNNLMSPFGDQKSLAFRRREDIMKLL
ncbi:hypothetical protein [Rickettsia sp. MEAM1 (Bemisia tabaci)]|uniref:hypothetical protein n=1 Tax=Rickettsia sp. MEAM1 (Bemisia tabaci) TaxID=1182263 RepID=UPI0018E0013C|nr:hypothetical protein [Rickettsia sp. MEAM1 (Bemisia tabaci)]